jgi:hypothetical protein
MRIRKCLTGSLTIGFERFNDDPCSRLYAWIASRAPNAAAAMLSPATIAEAWLELQKNHTKLYTPTIPTV